MYIKPIQIGKRQIDCNVFLAPMAGITDLPYRVLCKEQGAGLVYTEMVSSKGIFYQDGNTKQLMQIADEERPTAVQIFGSEPEIMGKIAKEVSQTADILDINMGCPAPKIIKNGEGSKLMLYPELVGKIVKAVVENSEVPVTIKIRKGWDEEHKNAVQIARIAQENGAQAITVHGRTRMQFYSGEVDLEIIKEVKENVTIPVIGNGDIQDAKTAKRMFDLTHCDAIMIGRASNGNPWIFKEIIEELKNETIKTKPTKEEKLQMILRHLQMSVSYKGEYTAIREMRKQIGWYLKGMPNVSETKNEINKIEHLKELETTLKKYFHEVRA